MSITGKWIDLIYKVATGNWKTRLLVTPLAGLLFLSLIGLFIFLSFIVDQSLKFPDILRFPWNIIGGIPVAAIGLVLMALSVIHFVKVRGTPVPFSPPPKLVKTGPYKYARNPMLTGLFILLFGVGIIFNSISLIVIFTPLFIIFNVWELKKIEEPELIKRFGIEYLEYKKEVNMFFPGFKAKTK